MKVPTAQCREQDQCIFSITTNFTNVNYYQIAYVRQFFNWPTFGKRHNKTATTWGKVSHKHSTQRQKLAFVSEDRLSTVLYFSVLPKKQKQNCPMKPRRIEALLLCIHFIQIFCRKLWTHSYANSRASALFDKCKSHTDRQTETKHSVGFAVCCGTRLALHNWLLTM